VAGWQIGHTQASSGTACTEKKLNHESKPKMRQTKLQEGFLPEVMAGRNRDETFCHCKKNPKYQILPPKRKKGRVFFKKTENGPASNTGQEAAEKKGKNSHHRSHAAIFHTSPRFRQALQMALFVDFSHKTHFSRTEK
jgi:hypothetical protein